MKVNEGIKFSEVTLEDKENATVNAAFGLQLRVENGIISVKLVALPSHTDRPTLES